MMQSSSTSFHFPSVSSPGRRNSVSPFRASSHHLEPFAPSPSHTSPMGNQLWCDAFSVGDRQLPETCFSQQLKAYIERPFALGQSRAIDLELSAAQQLAPVRFARRLVGSILTRDFFMGYSHADIPHSSWDIPMHRATSTCDFDDEVVIQERLCVFDVPMDA